MATLKVALGMEDYSLRQISAQLSSSGPLPNPPPLVNSSLNGRLSMSPNRSGTSPPRSGHSSQQQAQYTASPGGPIGVFHSEADGNGSGCMYQNRGHQFRSYNGPPQGYPTSVPVPSFYNSKVSQSYATVQHDPRYPVSAAAQGQIYHQGQLMMHHSHHQQQQSFSNGSRNYSQTMGGKQQHYFPPLSLPDNLIVSNAYTAESLHSHHQGHIKGDGSLNSSSCATPMTLGSDPAEDSLSEDAIIFQFIDEDGGGGDTADSPPS